MKDRFAQDRPGAELLAPAGNFQTALAAFAAGADAVYCGLSDFSARAFAENFSFEDLEKLLACARANGKKVYVTFNTILDEDRFDDAIETLARLEAAGPDGVIVQDLGVARLVRDRFPGLALHASTQLVAHNLEGVLAMKELGFVRVVLARELSLEEISSIAKRCGDVELEVFVHGALCYSLSGLCLYGAMEKDRSGNRGKCPYCCRQQVDGRYPFSMKDLRLGEDVRKLVDAGVASLKIEGRMKSDLYVASVTRYYRQILGIGDSGLVIGEKGLGRRVTLSDLETVFSRRTTELYFHGADLRPGTEPGPYRQLQHPNTQTSKHPNTQTPTQTPKHPNTQTPGYPVDPESLGHLGAEIGVVKRVTKDREGRDWLRFHTARALEKHDGLQFEAMAEGKHLGMGISLMREAISRHPVFEVAAGADVEIQLAPELAAALKPGMKIYCSMSNAVRRMFPTPSFRPSDYPGLRPLKVALTIGKDRVTATETSGGDSPAVSVEGRFEPAKNPEKTRETAEKAFSKLGGTGYRLEELKLDDPDRLFVPMSVWNDLRRDLVEAMDDRNRRIVRDKIEAAEAESFAPDGAVGPQTSCRRVKIRAGQPVPAGDWSEVIVAIDAETPLEELAHLTPGTQTPQHPDTQTPKHPDTVIRLSLPVYTSELVFNRLRSAVKRWLRAGYAKWEASDLATLRMLRQLDVTDITADWTLYAFNSRALATLSEFGVKRFVASPENSRENLQFLAESGFEVEFLAQQSTPLFMSLTEPAAEPADLAVFVRNGLWVTTKRMPRTFEVPAGVATRIDLSWDPS